MKKISAFLLLLFICMESYSQIIIYSPNTYYVIPPTSGCNGVWAVQYNGITCPMPQYTIAPIGCGTVNHVNGDTMFINLCSIPCNMIIADNMGNVCLSCSVSYSTDIEEKTSQENEISIYPNPANNEINIVFPDSGVSANITLCSIYGQILITEKISSTKNTIDISEFPKGLYLLTISINGKLYTEKIIKE